MEMYQQGDVLMKSVKAVPSDAKKCAAKDGLFVLAYGEVTGHKHAIEAVGDIEFLEKDGLFYIVNKKPVTVRHEEHNPVTVPAGIWEVSGVREYDHFQEESRRVVD